MMWKDFFYFSKRERNGIIVLLIFISGLFLGKMLFSRVEKSMVMDSLAKTDTVNYPTKTAQSEQYQPTSTYQRNDYRRQYAKSNPTYRERTPVGWKPPEPKKQYTPVYPKTEKYAPGIQLNINRADTSELKKIPGIGSGYANRIVNYRQRLGGYYSVGQVREVYGIDDELFAHISQWMKTEMDSLAQLPVNRASLEQLKSHPYISFYQAKAIVELRKRKGRLSEVWDLQLLEEFSSGDLERLQHYLSVE